MSSYFERVNPVERAIIGQLVEQALAEGFTVSVFDGEEWTLKKSCNLQAIRAEIGHTDETTLQFRKDGKIATFLLIHGNDCDVISDYSANETAEHLMATVEPVQEAYASMA